MSCAAACPALMRFSGERKRRKPLPFVNYRVGPRFRERPLPAQDMQAIPEAPGKARISGR
ncbi:MAG: hypothetical protein DRH56_02765 [Deltaproteobacteria bacterium]|nr:MAG: hypothetical protein DRH56_02765 [Deltaproteobacteria bacterium]